MNFVIKLGPNICWTEPNIPYIIIKSHVVLNGKCYISYRILLIHGYNLLICIHRYIEICKSEVNNKDVRGNGPLD